jgi:hypothetical protein
VRTHRTTPFCHRQVSDAVWSLLVNDETDGRRASPPCATQIPESIRQASSLTLRQIGVVFGYVENAAEARGIALRARAVAHTYASPAVVGAAGAVLGAVSKGDERSIADTLNRCRLVFDDLELFVGAIALLVGFLEQVAFLAELDVVTVAADVMGAGQRTRGSCRSRRGEVLV